VDWILQSGVGTVAEVPCPRRWLIGGDIGELDSQVCRSRCGVCGEVGDRSFNFPFNKELNLRVGIVNRRVVEGNGECVCRIRSLQAAWSLKGEEDVILCWIGIRSYNIAVGITFGCLWINI